MWKLGHYTWQNAEERMFLDCGAEKILESPLDYKEIKPDSPKGNQLWKFIGRTDAEALILWLFDVKSQLNGKDLDAGQNWGQEKKVTGGQMVGWHHWLNRQESEQTPRDSEGQGSLACCSPWRCKELDMTYWLNYITATNTHFKTKCSYQDKTKN